MIPERYVPKSLSPSDRKKQLSMINKSRKLYKKHKYFTRKKVHFKSKPSKHIQKAERKYGVKIFPNAALAKASGCPISALKKIVNKGEGAYYSSGSRPNQTPQSWGLARLASALTNGKAAKVDAKILEACH